MPFERDDLDSIHQRLLRLERQNRRLKQIGAAVVVAGAYLFFGLEHTQGAFHITLFPLSRFRPKLRVRLR